MHQFGPLLLALGLPLSGFALLGNAAPLARGLASAVAVACALRWLAWRWSLPLPPGGTLQQAWALGFLLVESACALAGLLLLGLLARRRDRSAEADAFAHLELGEAPTDIFLHTTAEPPEVLERSILGATRLSHPDVRVWVLDDGARPWVERLAEDLGALYLRRDRPAGGKAGAVGNALDHALTIGRRPDFLLLLDADVVPGRRLLHRVLPLFHDSGLGAVQLPRHAYNPDPVQANPLARRSWPLAWRFMPNVMQPSLDAWGAAHACGGAAMLRVAALVQAGGMAAAPETPERLTSLHLAGQGWHTALLDERLAQGLAPEGLAEALADQARWTRGSLRQMVSRWGFAGRGPLPLPHRLVALQAVLGCTLGLLLPWLVLLAPVLHWWAGLDTLAATPAELAWYLAPSLAATTVFMATLGGGWAWPFSHVATLLGGLGLLGRRMVAPRSTAHVVVQWRLLLPFALLAALTLAGPLTRMAGWNHGPWHGLYLGWSLLNLVVLAIAIAACVEPPRPRREERFRLDETATLRLPDGAALRCRVVDMGVTGARIDCDWPAEAGDRAELVLAAPPLVLPMEVTRGAEGGIAGRFIADAWLRRELIARLYTGDYANEAAAAPVEDGLVAAVRRLWG